MFLLKLPNAGTDQMKDLSISRTAFILGDIMLFVMQGRINLDAQMFVVFVAHNFTPKYLIASIL